MQYRPAVLKIPPALPRKGRPKVKPLVIPAGPPPLVVTAINDLEHDDSYAAMTVFLDVAEGQVLVDPVAADPAKWSTRIDGVNYVGTSVHLAADNALSVTFADDGAGPGPNVLGYAADPSEISEDDGRMLAAFENFPI